jgi:polyhydroxybutyrate depolymerase
MKYPLLLLSFLLATISGQAQLISDSIQVDGNYRTFHYQQPSAAQKGSIVIFAMHGSGGTGKDMMKPAGALQRVAEQEHILLVYPDGYKHYWNECRKGATSEANQLNINEPGFFNGMMEYFGKKYGTNTQQFFAIGLSGGGHMAYKLGMTLPDKCKAVSAVVASLPDTLNLDCTEAKKPLAVLISNGTKDPLNHYEGGDIIIGGNNWGAIRSTERTFDYWARLAGYTGSPTISPMPDGDTTNDQTITKYTYNQPGKPEVTLLKVNGGVHAFPKDIDIFLESWQFFKREMQREGKTKKR